MGDSPSDLKSRLVIDRECRHPYFLGFSKNKLIKLLRNSGLGRTIGSFYFVVLVYADDIILLCLSRIGLQAMINIFEQFAEDNNLKFSTNIDPRKSKTIGGSHAKQEAYNSKNINLVAY